MLDVDFEVDEPPELSQRLRRARGSVSSRRFWAVRSLMDGFPTKYAVRAILRLSVETARIGVHSPGHRRRSPPRATIRKRDWR